MQLHMLTSIYISLYAVTWACMQLHELECSSLSLHAVLSSSEQLTRISQCLFRNSTVSIWLWSLLILNLQFSCLVSLLLLSAVWANPTASCGNSIARWFCFKSLKGSIFTEYYWSSDNPLLLNLRVIDKASLFSQRLRFVEGYSMSPSRGTK